MNSDGHKSSHGLHVVLGGGQIGDRLASLLAARGERVRVVQRSAREERRNNVTRLAGDMTDLTFADAATAGARVVYDCMNPQYHQWPRHLLPLGNAALHGARKAGARLVALDCLYMYGVPDGMMREDSPRQPCSKKGALRVQLEELRMNAAKRGELEVAIGRASDFFGIDVPLSAFGPRFFEGCSRARASSVWAIRTCCIPIATQTTWLSRSRSWVPTRARRTRFGICLRRPRRARGAWQRAWPRGLGGSCE